MQVFHIRYRNAQGALMRILNAVSRRGLDLHRCMPSTPGRNTAVTMLLEVTHKQIGQLYREWYAIVDVVDVRSGAACTGAEPQKRGRRIRRLRRASREQSARAALA